ncbi:hypothetical protein AWH56_025090 [Anaerobacillus isosaccharinicus]|uniref:Uncharacterized protein n=1 Tax=Anaerobacillus isosaccharinicus TaxID=1532552 RepID=A0A1S2M3R5_9BACI|nr:hypothetical protein [Anaerobacillus isosaccharinicus]MBA5585816.1 hypothetical protein [Anaerobacillus isosaccharinicus]QOY35887.1 hypothetical protein AWH56_025090 [Anaerobacillus isosaccharinicus]
MKKRILFLIIGFWCLKLSTNMFPTFESFTAGAVWQTLIFSPFKWFGAIFLFTIGFLAIARVIKTICEQVVKNSTMKKELPWVIVVVLQFFIVSFESLVITGAAVGFSLFYGIMDANIQRKNRHFNN